MIAKVAKIACLSIFVCSSLSALSLKESIEKVLDENPEVIAEKRNQEAFRKYIDERRANYYPRVDIDGKLEKSNMDRDYDIETDGTTDGSIQEDGYNVGIAINQMLYDGNLTPSQVAEAKHNYKANRFRTEKNIQAVVHDTIVAYNDLVKYKELLFLSEDILQTNEKNLQVAKEKQEISGEVLETFQVDSKISFLKDQYLEQKDLEASKTATFKRYVGIEPQGDECRMQIDESKIPASLQTIVEEAVLNNYEIKEQIEKIKAQREVIAQKDASFLPNLTLELKALTDNDLILNENGIENQAYGRINLNWNLYNGGGDKAVSKQAQIFLAEEKKRLDAVTNKIVETIKVTYQRYLKNKERTENLKNYVIANEGIVKVYKSEFEAGTRTFVDILDAQMDIFEAKKSLLNREFETYANYYTLLETLGKLNETIINTKNQECTQSITIRDFKKISDEDSLDETQNEEVSDELSTLLGDSPVKKEEKLIINEEEKSSEFRGTSFLDAPQGYYTLNIATKLGEASAREYSSMNNLDNDETFIYTFGPDLKSAKVIYGIFSSIKEAKQAMENLPTSVLANKPYIDNISKHQKLYKKYH